MLYEIRGELILLEKGCNKRAFPPADGKNQFPQEQLPVDFFHVISTANA